MSHPTIAQETFAAGASINDQNGRVSSAYNNYLSKCINLDNAGQAQRLLQMGIKGCDEARADFKLQTDILVRLIHGEPPTIICSEDGCPEPQE